MKQNGGSECVTASEGLEHAKQERAKAGQSVQLEDDDYMTVRLLSKSEQQSGHPITSSCYIKYIDEFEFAWKRDFYDLYLKNRKNLSLVLELFGTPKGSNDPAQPIAEELGHALGRLPVGEMAVPPGDALLERPRIGAAAQHLEIVVGLEHQGVQLQEPPPGELRAAPEVGGQANPPTVLVLDHETHRLAGVMG